MMRGTTLACLVLLISGVGCAEQTADRRQIAWHDALDRTSATTNDATPTPKRLSVQTLDQICGRPDLETTVKAFADMLGESATTRGNRSEISTLYFAYCTANHLPVNDQRSWQSDEGFLNTRAWIYDERRHFRAPLPDSSGFDSYVFLISDREVIGSSVIIASPVWKRVE